MTLFPVSPESQAYADGYRNGQIDKRMGFKSEYAWNGVLDISNPYSQAYAQGYRNGWLGLSF